MTTNSCMKSTTYYKQLLVGGSSGKVKRIYEKLTGKTSPPIDPWQFEEDRLFTGPLYYGGVVGTKKYTSSEMG